MKLGRTLCLIPLALALVAAIPADAATGGKRAFEIADYYRTAFVDPPAVSPDGRHIAFPVRRYDLDKKESWTEIWMMAPDGSDLRQMTFGRHDDGSPVFAADGKSLFFTSDREAKAPQLWRMAVDGGSAHKLTDFPMGVEDPVVSGDGRWIAVTSEVFPECGADGDCSAKIEKGLSEGKLQAHLADHLLYRHWTAWRDGKYRHILLIDATTGKVVKDLTPGRFDSPTFSLGGRAYDFSPDGKELCYVSNHEPHPESSTNSDLWRVPVEGEITESTAVDLTAANRGWDGSPLYSPDGRFIAFRSQATAGYESDLFRLAIYERGSKAVRYLTDRASFDNWVDDMAWLPDGRGLIFQGELHGRNPLFRVAIGGGSIEPILADGTIDGWKLLPDGSGVVYSRRSVGQPPEIFRAPLAVDARGGARLTRFNAALEAEVDIRPAEEMWVPGDGGEKIHVFVVKPHDFDPTKKYPLILNVHGGPQYQWQDAYRADWQVYPGKGYVVAFPNPTGSTGYGQEFTDAIAGDWGGRVFRDLMKVTDALEKLPYVDSGRMGSMGWSFGGYMMMWFEGNTDRFGASAAMMGVYDLTAMYGATEELWFPEHDLGGTPWTSDLYRKWSPSEHVASFKTPCLVLTGEHDFRVPYTQSLEFFTDLQKMGVPSRLIVFKKAGHWPSWYEMALYYDAHLDWFHRYLGGGEAPWDVEKMVRNEVFGQEEGPAEVVAGGE